MGGFDELPGVFGGWVSWSSRASRAAMRASCAAIRWSANASLAVSAAISASFSAWLSAGVGSSGTRRVDSTRALPCQELSHADRQGNRKRPRLRQERIWLTGVSNYVIPGLRDFKRNVPTPLCLDCFELTETFNVSDFIRIQRSRTEATREKLLAGG